MKASKQLTPRLKTAVSTLRTADLSHGKIAEQLGYSNLTISKFFRRNNASGDLIWQHQEIVRERWRSARAAVASRLISYSKWIAKRLEGSKCLVKPSLHPSSVVTCMHGCSSWKTEPLVIRRTWQRICIHIFFYKIAGFFGQPGLFLDFWSFWGWNDLKLFLILFWSTVIYKYYKTILWKCSNNSARS